jgi:integrase
VRGRNESWRPHDLRHWSATQAIVAGYDVQTVARRLGHADATTTLLPESPSAPSS